MTPSLPRFRTILWLIGSLTVATSLTVALLVLSKARLFPEADQPSWLFPVIAGSLFVLAFRFSLRAVRTSLAATMPPIRIFCPAADERPKSDVAIIVPVILRSMADIEGLRASALRLLNEPGTAGYPVVYLVDLPDLASRIDPADGRLLSAIRTVFGVDVQDCASAPHVQCLVRERRYNDEDGVWMGWERKRGKILEFMKLIRGDLETSFTSRPVGLDHIRYVFVADADTTLKDGCVAMLREAARAVESEVARPGIFGPSIEYAPSQVNTLFRKLRTVGLFRKVDAFRTASDNQMVFGGDLFFGKGLLEISAFLECMPEDLPENRLLSHDHLEAILAGAVHVGQAAVAEPCPPSAASWMARHHRWVRGDLQAFALVAGRPLSLWGRGQMIETLVGHLAPISLVFVAIALLLTGQADFPPLFVGLLCVASSCAVLLAAPDVIVLNRSLRVKSGRDRAKALGNHLFGVAISSLVEFVFLWQTARTNVLAIVETLWRFLVSRRRFLKWDSYEGHRKELVAFFCDSTVWLVLVLAVGLHAPENLASAYALGITWIGLPLTIALGDRAMQLRRESVADDRRSLTPSPSCGPAE